MKSKHVSVPMTPAQEDHDEARVAARVLSLGLFVLGLDGSGDYGLSEIADAIHGKGSEDAKTLYNMIGDAGSGARDAIENAMRDRRQDATRKAKAEEAEA